MTWHQLLPASLRARYLLLVGALCVGLGLVGLWAQASLQQVSGDGTAQLQTRQNVHRLVLSVRVALFDAYQGLNRFLLDPGRGDYRRLAGERLNQAILDSDRLLASPWTREHPEQHLAARELKVALVALGSDFGRLIETRLDPVRQYPSMAVSAQRMQPSHDRFAGALAVGLAELSGGGSWPVTLHSAFQNLRYHWAQLINAYRVYLANRMGSFDEAALPGQLSDIEQIYSVVEDELLALSTKARLQPDALQLQQALVDMQSALAEWRDGFVEVKRIHASPAWRADAGIIKTDLEPRLTHITDLLGRIEDTVTAAAASDLQKLSDNTRTLTRLGWLLGALGLSFVVLIVLSLDHVVFRPLRAIANALKQEAFVADPTPLPQVTYREGQNLLEAFVELRKQVHQRQSALKYEATHDALTGLPNRTLLQDRLKQAIGNARRQQGQVVLLVMDLNRFKDINDTLGHQVGDQILIEAGQRLTERLRDADTIARLGGDEYGILLVDTARDHASAVAEKIRDTLAAPFLINEMKLYVGASIGSASYPEDAGDADTLIQRADVAMYVAKDRQEPFAFYQRTQDGYSIGRLALMGELRSALAENTLDVHFQPKIDVATGQVEGAEALLRWNHDKFGPIPPDQVIALAEHTGLIGAVTYWVLDRALQASSPWRRDRGNFNLAVNLSVHNLRDRGFADQVRDCLAAHGFPATALTLEITEHAMMSNRTDAMAVLKELDIMGVRLSVDDYGTGFSSLAYLKQLPVNELKIDRSFVMRMDHNPNDDVIVRSTIELAHNLGLTVVAEGVENEACMERLRLLGCDVAQGFHLSRPLPAERFDAWLEGDGSRFTSR